MEPKDPTWDDTGFGPDEDGFMESGKNSELNSENESIPESTSDAATETSAERRRVDALPPMPPMPEAHEKKNRTALFWFGIAAGFVLIVALIGGGYYFLNKPSIEEQAFMAPEVVPSEPAPPALDTATVALDSVPAPEPLFADAELPAKGDDVPSVEPRSKAEERTMPRPRRTAPSEPLVAPLPKPVPSVPKIATTPATSNVGAMWVVQVFSSPSRDDADEWLQTLREKRVQDGYIVEQQLRGQPWYRVRFGQFSTREDAEAAAVNLGFRQPWIARIR